MENFLISPKVRTADKKDLYLTINANGQVVVTTNPDGAAWTLISTGYGVVLRHNATQLCLTQGSQEDNYYTLIGAPQETGWAYTNAFQFEEQDYCDGRKGIKITLSNNDYYLNVAGDGPYNDGSTVIAYGGYNKDFNETWIVVPVNDRWMANLNQDALLINTTIPASHDASTYYENIGQGDGAKTQSGDYIEQLNAGVRYFDIRVQWAFDVLVLHHNMILFESFESVLANQIAPWLAAHPTELVFLDIDFKDPNGFTVMVDIPPHIPYVETQAVEALRLLEKYIYPHQFATAHLNPDKTFNPAVTWGQLRGSNQDKQYVVTFSSMFDSVQRDWLAKSDDIRYSNADHYADHNEKWILEQLQDKVDAWKANRNKLFIAQVIDTPAFSPHNHPNKLEYLHHREFNNWVMKQGIGDINIVMRDFVNADYNRNVLQYVTGLNTNPYNKSFQLKITSPCSLYNKVGSELSQIQLNDTVLAPTNQPDYMRGVQVLVLDSSKDLSASDAVRCNVNYSYGPWTMNEQDPSYLKMERNIASDLMNNYRKKGDVVVLTTFNREHQSLDDDNFLALLKNIGCERTFLNAFSEGVQGCYNGGSVLYTIIGQFDAEPDSAVVYFWFDSGGEGENTRSEVKISVFAQNGGYTLGLGDLITPPDAKGYQSLVNMLAI